MCRQILSCVFFAVLAGLLWSPAGLAQGRRGTPPSRKGQGGVTLRQPWANLGVIERLERMPPEQRQRVLDRLPPDRRQHVENQLRQYEQIPEIERERLRKQLQNFQAMSQERQAAARELFRKFNDLPKQRQQVLREDFLNLRQMNPTDRRARLDSEEFRNRYSQDELKLFEELDGLLKLGPFR